MNQPIRSSSTTTSVLVLDWNPLVTNSETGGSEILSYHVQWDKNTNGVEWYDL